MKYIDLRSDTVTEPTKEMKEAMYNASVGDDVYDDDPTILELEEKSAKLLGKERGLFIPSGTFGNQLSIFTHCKRGQEIILGDDCHIVEHEAGSASIIAGVQLRTLESNKGELNPDKIEEKIRKIDDIHYPSTGLICLENAHSNGRVISLENMKIIKKIADKYQIPVHLDGARIFNAASYLDVDPKEIAKYTDSVTFCLSKALCCPVGSVLVGSEKFIFEAKKKRKIMGGALRQAGFLAAPGLIAIDKMRKRLNEDHENAKYLAKKLNEIENIELNVEDVQINLVFFKINKNIEEKELLNKMFEKNIKINPPDNGYLRFATHYWINKENIDLVVSTLNEIIN